MSEIYSRTIILKGILVHSRENTQLSKILPSNAFISFPVQIFNLANESRNSGKKQF